MDWRIGVFKMTCSSHCPRQQCLVAMSGNPDIAGDGPHREDIPVIPASADASATDLFTDTELFLERVQRVRPAEKCLLTMLVKELIYEAERKSLLSVVDRTHALELLTKNLAALDRILTTCWDQSNFKLMSSFLRKKFLLKADTLYEYSNKIDDADVKAMLENLVGRFARKETNKNSLVLTSLGKNTKWSIVERGRVLEKLTERKNVRVRLFNSWKEQSLCLSWWVGILYTCVVEVVYMVNSGSFAPLPLGVVSHVTRAWWSGVEEWSTLLTWCFIGLLCTINCKLAEWAYCRMLDRIVRDYVYIKVVNEVMTQSSVDNKDLDSAGVALLTETKDELKSLFHMRFLGRFYPDFKVALKEGSFIAAVVLVLSHLKL